MLIFYCNSDSWCQTINLAVICHVISLTLYVSFSCLTFKVLFKEWLRCFRNTNGALCEARPPGRIPKAPVPGGANSAEE